MKKYVVLCVSILCFMMPLYASQVKYVEIKLHDKLVEQTDETGRAYIDAKTQLTLVPLRFLSDQLGYKTEWNQLEKVATIQNDKNTILISLESPFAIVNENPVILNTPAVLKDNKIYIPLRFVSEIMGILTTYDKGVISIG